MHIISNFSVLSAWGEWTSISLLFSCHSFPVCLHILSLYFVTVNFLPCLLLQTLFYFPLIILFPLSIILVSLRSFCYCLCRIFPLSSNTVVQLFFKLLISAFFQPHWALLSAAGVPKCPKPPFCCRAAMPSASSPLALQLPESHLLGFFVADSYFLVEIPVSSSALSLHKNLSSNIASFLHNKW